jgi:hypothetical protein
VTGEPVDGEVRDVVEGSWFLEEVGGAWGDRQLGGAAQLCERLLVELEHGAVVAARSSSGVSRSSSSVASLASLSVSATYRLRGLWRLLPLPWAKIATPVASSGTTRSPRSHHPG